MTSNGNDSPSWESISVKANVTIQQNPPGSPSGGDLWWDSDDGNLYIYYEDGSSNQWVAVSGGGSGGGGVNVKEEGSVLSTTATTLNFVGSGVVASGTGEEKTITISGSGSGNIPIGGVIMWSGASNPEAIPSGYLLCDGQSTSGYTALAAIVGDNVPDLRERFIVGAGGDNSTVSGTSGYNVNATGGENSVTLTVNQMPAHTHDIQTGTNQDSDGSSRVEADSHFSSSNFASAAKSRGGGAPHENRPPYYALCYIIKV